MDVDISNSVSLTLTATSGVDFVHIGNNENPHCVYNSDCIVDLIQHSFNAFSLYPRDKLLRRSLTARSNNNNASKSLMSQRLSPNLPLWHSIAPSTRSSSSSVVASYAEIYSEMTTFVAQPPGSPGLTASKSSKSSSFHSYLSGTEAKFFDNTNFEEIYIDEGNSSQYRDLHNNDNKRPPLRKTSIAMNGGIGNDHATTNQRELTNGSQRPPYPNLQTKSRITAGPPTHSLNLPRGKSSKKGFTSPSAPSLAMTAMSNLSRSRSPSPSQTPNPGLLYPTSPYFSPRPQSLSPEMNKPPVRRGSWQPSKKSVKELEDEYDDLDEDLPEEASLWNVPLSPRPCHERAPTSAANSTHVSPRTSPERSNPLCSSANNNINVAKSQSPKPLPIISPKEASSDKFLSKLPPSPSKLRYSRGVSTGDIPDNFYFPKHRSKTWDVALSELSEEAKSLTEALESHAEASERQQEQTVQSSTSSITPSMNKIPRAKTCSVELPPLRISNVMIDPLPASKEKEKVLSRTRPSWLPPKDRKEERKHLKEYQRMMTQSVEAGKLVLMIPLVVPTLIILSEKKKALKAASAQCVQDDTKNALLRIWEEHVLPNWDQVIREPRTRELWWRGVAPRSRAQVWEKAIGNDLALTEVTYTKALQRAKDMEVRIAQASPEERFKESVWFEAIRRDIKAVFPELKIFRPGGPLHDGLVDVLMAYSMYRSDVGYSHGTHVSHTP